MIKRKLLINSEIIKDFLEDDKIVIVDAGARGSLFKPFDKVKSNLLKVILFEPDKSAEVKIDKNKIYFNKGIWHEKDRKKLHITKKGGNSSVYPPDKFRLESFKGKGSYSHRKPVKFEWIELDSLDSLLKNNRLEFPDFIKLDIHSSEFEALNGAKKTLEKSCLGIFVEAWTYPVHKHQKLYADVEKLLNNFNFFLFDLFSISKWKRNNNLCKSSRRQIIFLEALYFKDLFKIKNKKQAIKFLCFLDIYGYFEFLSFSLDYFKNKKIISKGEYNLLKNQIKSNKSLLNDILLNLVQFNLKFFSYLYNKI